MNRRTRQNHALAHAIDRANHVGLPLLVYEGLTCTYPYANDRIHTFMLENVPGFHADIEKLGAGYFFYLRRRRSDPNDIVYRLAEAAAQVVTDDYPTFIPADHNRSVPSKIGVAFEAVDASCIVPASTFAKQEWAAYTIRPKIQRALADYLHPLTLPKLKHRWAGPTPEWHSRVSPEDVSAMVASCEIDHSVPPSTCFRGGYPNAQKRLDLFLKKRLHSYPVDRNQPALQATSNLSPYLHFGHISSLEVALAARDCAEEHGISASEFLEELIVRREL
ncbi:MAG TPA: deoxyribodipyrimidine photo-lyase, partial [Bryobacteraceae bacterium]|nr:deoxyribodipyrimidine photo-lyase [Bryobacteraceae bacterium]